MRVEGEGRRGTVEEEVEGAHNEDILPQDWSLDD